MTNGRRGYLVVAAVLALAGLAGETRYQYQYERALAENSAAFYDCCGLSRLEILKTKAVVRILSETPGMRAKVAADAELVAAWGMATGMAKVDVLRPAVTQFFRDYGNQAELLLEDAEVAFDELTALEKVLRKGKIDSAYQPALSDQQREQLGRLRFYSSALLALTEDTLLGFAELAVREGFEHDPATLLNWQPYYDGSRPLGVLAMRVLDPRPPMVSKQTNCWGLR